MSTLQTVSSGTISNPAIWDAGRTPRYGDIVYVLSGHTLVLGTSPLTCGQYDDSPAITVNAGGTLSIPSGGTGNAYLIGRLQVDGYLDNSGVFNIYGVLSSGVNFLRKNYLMEIDAGYLLRHWGTTGTTGVYSRAMDQDVDVAKIVINGTETTQKATLALCGTATGTYGWFLQRGTGGTSSLYVHNDNGDINGDQVRVDLTLHLARENCIVPKTNLTTWAVEPFFYEGRLESIPSISYFGPQNTEGGGISPVVSQVQINNMDGKFDAYVSRVLLKNQPVRLYDGNPGGTLPFDYSLRQNMLSDTPEITRERFSINLTTQSSIAKKKVNSGKVFSVSSLYASEQSSGGLSFDGQGIPVVMGPFRGFPAYRIGVSGAGAGTGTYQFAAHSCQAVTAARYFNGTTENSVSNMTIVSSDLSNGIFYAVGVEGESGQNPPIVYIDGTGYNSGGIPTKAGEIIQYLLGSIGGLSGTLVGTTSMTQIDTDRSLTLSCWFGRDETIAECLDFVCRSSFTSWTTDRVGVVQAIAHSSALPKSISINNWNFERGTASYGNPSAYDDFATAFPTRSSTAKMWFYSSTLLGLISDDTGGNAVYRGTTLFSSGTQSMVRLTAAMKNLVGGDNLHSGTVKILNRFSGATSGYSAYEVVLPYDETDPRTITLNRVVNGTITLLGTGSIPFGLGGTLKQIDLYAGYGGGSVVRVEVNGTEQISATEVAGTELGSGYGGFLVGSRTVGTLPARLATAGWFHSSGTVIDPSATWSLWYNAGSAFHRGTTPGHFAYSGTITGVLCKGSGAEGTLARIYGSGYGATVGTDYVVTCVAALQSGAGSNFRLSYSDSAGTEYLGGTVNLKSGTFQRAWCHFRPSNGGAGTISIYPDYGGTLAGTCWVDNIQFYPVKTINPWQVKGFLSFRQILPLNNQVRVRYWDSAGTFIEVPPPPFSSSLESKTTYYTAHGTQGSNADNLYPGLEERIVDGFCYGSADAQVVADAMLDFYSQPRAEWTASFLDLASETMNLWDIVYVNGGRFPGINDENRLFLVTELEDIHPKDSPTQTVIKTEAIYNQTYDIMLS